MLSSFNSVSSALAGLAFDGDIPESDLVSVIAALPGRGRVWSGSGSSRSSGRVVEDEAVEWSRTRRWSGRGREG